MREVANELSVLENSLSKWVRDERRRLDAVAGTSEKPLTPAERAELIQLRRQVTEQEKGLLKVLMTTSVRGLVSEESWTSWPRFTPRSSATMS